MMERVAVLGATGVYGRHLLPRLTAAGYRVRALVRRPDAATLAAACGAELAAADIFDEASLRAGLIGCDIAINLATSLPGPSSKGDYAKNDEIRREGTPIFVRACRAAGVPRIVQQSIAMIHAGGGDAWADETTSRGRRRRSGGHFGGACDGSDHRGIGPRLARLAGRPLLWSGHRFR